MTARLTIFHDPAVLRHDTGAGVFEAPPSPLMAEPEAHPENAARLRNMVSILEKGPLADALDWRRAAPASLDDLASFHDADYLAALSGVPADAGFRSTATTVFGPGSWAAIRAGAGQAIAAAHRAWDGGGPAYALIRPPGHHAQPDRADGYCFVNNIGVAVNVLRRRHGLRRACVIDWDVHHGNGTQAGFYGDPDVLTISLHMNHGAWGPRHPQTGAADEVGDGAGRGANLNIPMPYGAGDRAYAAAWERFVEPAVKAHGPEMLFVASGQDASQFDPNGRQLLSMAGFLDLGARARALAENVSGGRLMLAQEGGYAVSYAAFCLHATLEGVLGRTPALEDPLAFMPEALGDLDAAFARIETARAAALAVT
jgi:acetoin utilization deacetylase AcuC-like enzyme